MFNKILTTFLLIVISIPVFAQNTDLQKSIKDLSSEMASINQQIVQLYQNQQNEIKNPYREHEPQYGVNTNTQKEQSKDMYETIINKVKNLEERYKDNPYITITGFDINIGIPPSVSISFEFK